MMWVASQPEIWKLDHLTYLDFRHQNEHFDEFSAWGWIVEYDIERFVLLTQFGIVSCVTEQFKLMLIGRTQKM